MKKIILGFLASCYSSLSFGQGSDPEAIKKADLMIERLGGHKPWGEAKHQYAKERINRLTIKGEITGEFWRGYSAPAYMEKIKGVDIDVMECRDAKIGWTLNRGKLVKMSEEDFVAEWGGSSQEPYQIYHRLGRRDSTLIVKLTGENRLDFYEKNGRHLCWILIDADARVVSWGNIYRGRLNQHLYGPLKKFGDIYMPAWGVAVDGNFRFEYLDVQLLKEPLELPPPPGKLVQNK